MIESAFYILLMKGYNCTNVREIMESVGMGKGSFANYFSSKEEMALTVLEAFIAKQLEWQKQALSDLTLSPINRIKRYFEVLIDFFENETKYKGGCLAGNFSLEIADVNERFRKRLDEFFTQLNSAFSDCVKEGQESNEIITTMHHDDLAELIMITWEGAVLRMKTMENGYALSLYLNDFFNMITIKA